MNINMGGIATLAYDSGTGGYGANAVDNVVPTAWEEIDYGLTTGITDVGAVSASKGVVNLTIKSPNSGTGVSFSYVSRMGGGHIADGGTDGDTSGGRAMDFVVDLVNVDQSQFGLRMGMAGEMEFIREPCKVSKTDALNASCGGAYLAGDPYGGTIYTTMKLGPLSLGVQGTFKDPMDASIAGIANKRAIVAGAALMFGDTISFSYGQAWDRYKYNDATRGFGGQTRSGQHMADGGGAGSEYETITYNGFSAAINMGPVALKGTRNRVNGWGEGSSNTGEGLDKRHTEINLSIAF